MTCPLPDSVFDEVLGLTLTCLGDEASPEDVERLNELLCNEVARRVYEDVIRDSFSLRRWADATKLHSGEIFDGCESDAAFLRLATADPDLLVATASTSRKGEPRDTVPGLLLGILPTTVGFYSSDWPVAYLVATVVMAVGLLVCSFIHVSQPGQVAKQAALPSPSGRGAESMLPSPSGRGAGGEGRDNVAHSHPIVGRITGMVDCQFAKGSGFGGQGSEISKSPNFQNSKSLVSLGDKFVLASGLMEITYDNGAKVILQGPVSYEVESPAGGFLSFGKLTARVDKRDASFNREPTASASAAAISKSPNLQISKCVVRTPTAIVTDLGTEFGVEVSKEGHTTSHVFRGLVRLQVASADGKTEGVTQVLHENESARVENRDNQSGGNRIAMLGPSAKPTNFVRQISKRTVKIFDLVDVVAGGGGFSNKRGRGIDPTTGQPVSEPPHGKRLSLVDDGRYHRVEAMPMVDGVFVPYGSTGRVQVDSAGHSFTGFLTTSSQTRDYIWAGGAIPTTYPRPVNTILSDIDYARPGHGALSVPSNNGITFNLDAIRQANPGFRLRCFRAEAGDTEIFSRAGDFYYSADLWVFVDGEVRFRRRQIRGTDGAYSVVVPIAEKDRFLSLATTDGGDGVDYDWIIFGDPKLELVSDGTAGSSASQEQPGQKVSP